MTRPAGTDAPPSSVRRFAGRMLAALVMGAILLVLSGLLYSAAAADLGGGWSSLWITWLGAALASLLVALSAPSARVAWGRL